jgi:Cu(I)/Ag(I) efflux system membrane fusion protein
MVPAEAVVDTGEAKYVFVAREGGRFEPRIVEPGPRQGDQVEIVKGLAEGETVVTTGNFLIDSESRLRAALAR